MAVGAIVMFIIAVLIQGRIEPFDQPLLGPGYTMVANQGVYGIVIDERFGPRFFSERRRESIDGYWTPEADDIAMVEDLIRSKRPGDGQQARERGAERPPGDRERIARIEALVSRQYIGFSANGVNYIKVIGFCGGGLPNFPLRRLIVADGGPCYWTALIDADSRTIASYAENGEA